MEKHQINEIYRCSGLNIALITSCSVNANVFLSNSVIAYSACMQPVWVVIRKPQQSYALNMRSEVVSVDALSEAIPELKEFLTAHNEHKHY